MSNRSQHVVGRRKIAISTATDGDLRTIYGLRHDVYAEELGQHVLNEERLLTDSLDSFNTYLVARIGDELAGFISITPPSHGEYSVDKYFQRDDVPFAFDDRLFELRILTVRREFRGSWAVPVLMYGALRWVEARGGENLVAIGRAGLSGLYEKAGFRRSGKTARSGQVTYELMFGDVDTSRSRFESQEGIAGRMERIVDWQLDCPMKKPKAAFHGGAFFDAIGREFDDLNRVSQVINADVLDAWFPPSEKVIDVLREHLNWAIVTSPPTGAEGLISRIASTRGVDPRCVLPSSGSSSLMYTALRHLASSGSTVLLLEPAYGEYSHVFQSVLSCHVDRFVLRREEGFEVDLTRLEAKLKEGYDVVVIVNPNNPTGRMIERDELVEVLERAPSSTLFWIDETYVDYVGQVQSLESYASKSENVIVCKSMSKSYALSGLRVGYLCGPRNLVEDLRMFTPPWSVSLPAQIAAVKALQDLEYYAERYRETHQLRDDLADGSES